MGQKCLSQSGSVPGVALSRHCCWSLSLLVGWSTKHDKGIVVHNCPKHLSTWGCYWELWSLGAHRGGADCSWSLLSSRHHFGPISSREGYRQGLVANPHVQRRSQGVGAQPHGVPDGCCVVRTIVCRPLGAGQVEARGQDGAGLSCRADEAEHYCALADSVVVW